MSYVAAVLSGDNSSAPVDARDTSCILDPFSNFISRPDTNDQAMLVPEIEVTQVVHSRFSVTTRCYDPNDGKGSQ